MKKRPTIREQIDACRPDSDDLHMPEHAADLAELQAALREPGEFRNQWEQSQREGRVVRAAVHDVSLPAGLEARLLAAVQAAEKAPLASVEQAVKENVPGEESTVVLANPVPTKTSRRWLFIAGPVAAAALILGVVAIQSLRKVDQPISRDQLTSQVESWLLKIDVNTMKPGKPVALPTEVLGTVPSVGSFVSNQGNITAYSLRRGGNSAFLLVLPTTTSYPVPALPYMKLPGISGGWEVGTWQSGGILYVIAVPSNSGRLSDFVRQPQLG